MLGLPVNVGTKNPLLLNPRSNFMTSWDALVGVLLLYTAIWTPYEVAFVEGGTDSIAVVLNLRFSSTGSWTLGSSSTCASTFSSRTSFPARTARR